MAQKSYLHWKHIQPNQINLLENVCYFLFFFIDWIVSIMALIDNTSFLLQVEFLKGDLIRV